MTMSFAAATTPTSTRQPGHYSVELDPSWTILTMPNGGYLLAVLARAAAAHLGSTGSPHAWPVAATALYAAAPSCGPATVEATILRAGRSATQVRASLHQDGEEQVAGTFTFKALPASPATYESLPPVELPPVEDCLRLPGIGPSGQRTGILEVTDERLDPACCAWTRGERGPADLRGWVRLEDDEAIDPFTLLYVVDCFPPATFNLGSIGWVPTLQLTAYVRAIPAPGWLRVRQFVQEIGGGLVDEVCQVWDSTGRLVAHGTQLAQVRFEA